MNLSFSQLFRTQWGVRTFHSARSRKLRRAALTAAVAALPACDRLQVDAPPPAVAADAETLSPLPSSTLNIPLTYDLSPVIAALEAAVPRRFGSLAERHQIPGRERMHVAFEARREPFRVSLDGQTARITAIVHYAGRGWYDARLAPEVSASCGIDDARPRALIEIASPLRITPAWGLRGRTRIVRVAPLSAEPRDLCRVTFLSIDVTARVLDATRSLLEDKRTFIDTKIAQVALRPRFEEWWLLLQKPIQLTDNVWLDINPTAVRMGKPVGTRRTLVTALGFSASPRVVTGQRPADGTLPLPPLETAAVGDGLHILLEGVLDYELASRLLRQQIVGKSISRAGQTLEVKQARLFGIGDGKLALELRVDGSTRAHVYLVGTPVYDQASGELYVPDLDYDVGSQSLLVSGFEWLRHEEVRNFIRQQARWPVGDVMAVGRQHLHDGLNRELAPGVKLTADVNEVQGLAVHARRSEIRLRAQADANATLTVRQGP